MQAPQPRSKAATTRSPFLKFFTSGPTSSTMPMNCGNMQIALRPEATVVSGKVALEVHAL
jgi:hypothetical protein